MNSDPAMKAAAELAAKFLEYGNILTGFCIAQTLFFAYALGKQDGGLRDRLLAAWSTIKGLIWVAGFLYVGLIIGCGAVEYQLRGAAGHGWTVQKWSLVAVGGRVVVTACMTFLGLLALKHNPPDTSKTSDQGFR